MKTAHHRKYSQKHRFLAFCNFFAGLLFLFVFLLFVQGAFSQSLTDTFSSFLFFPLIALGLSMFDFYLGMELLKHHPAKKEMSLMKTGLFMVHLAFWLFAFFMVFGHVVVTVVTLAVVFSVGALYVHTSVLGKK